MSEIDQHPVNDNPRMFTVSTAAKHLALSRSMLYNLMERGALAYVKIGRARRIPAEEIDRLIRDSLIDRRKVVAAS